VILTARRNSVGSPGWAGAADVVPDTIGDAEPAAVWIASHKATDGCFLDVPDSSDQVDLFLGGQK